MQLKKVSNYIKVYLQMVFYCLLNLLYGIMNNTNGLFKYAQDFLIILL